MFQFSPCLRKASLIVHDCVSTGDIIHAQTVGDTNTHHVLSLSVVEKIGLRCTCDRIDVCGKALRDKCTLWAVALGCGLGASGCRRRPGFFFGRLVLLHFILCKKSKHFFSTEQIKLLLRADEGL